MLFIFSCRKASDFPNTPDLTWIAHEIQDEAATNRRSIQLHVFFTDGDGDIGLPEGQPYDTCDKDGYNLQISYYEKVGGSFVEILPQDPCLPFHNIIPEIEVGQNKVLEGDLYTTFSYLSYPENPNVDSVRFELVLVDRAGNRSDIAASPSIFIPPR